MKDSKGEVRAFALTVGLQEGYGDGENVIVHSVEEAVTLLESYLKQKAAKGEPFLTGIVSEGTVVYAWPEGPGKSGSGHEPQIVFSGEVTPLYLSDLSDGEVEEFLNGLASFLGEKLNQTRVYVKYRSETWIIQKEGANTPSGD